jgi:hypothetical protein
LLGCCILPRMEQARFQIPTRDLKLFLGAAVEVTRNPELATRLLQLCERNERALEQARAEQHELACMRDEHSRKIAEAAKKSREQLEHERSVWAVEVAQRRKRLELEEDEIERQREFAIRDRERAAELRDRLERKFERKSVPAEAGVGPEHAVGQAEQPQQEVVAIEGDNDVIHGDAESERPASVADCHQGGELRDVGAAGAAH